VKRSLTQVPEGGEIPGTYLAATKMKETGERADGRGSRSGVVRPICLEYDVRKVRDDSIPLDFVLFEELHRTIAQVAVAGISGMGRRTNCEGQRFYAGGCD